MTTFGAVRTARIEHDCTVCGLPVRVGQQYREWRIPPGDIEVGNEKWARFRLHLNGQCNSRRPRLLDLCCSAGGAAMGYHRAGFDVTGVDIADQPNYPFTFIKADAVTFPLDGFDAIHASPPCQSYSGMSNCRPGLAAKYPQLIDVIRPRLIASGIPWVIENVEGSGLATQDDFFGAHGLTLCGMMFGLPLYRHRLFETSAPVRPPHHPRHLIPGGRAGHWNPGEIISVAGNCSPIALAREAMGGIDWMTRDELAESIPPPFAKYLGRALLEQMEAAA